MSVQEIEPLKLKELLGGQGKPFLLDVREVEEFEAVALEDALLVPLMELESRFEEVKARIEESDTTVVYCRLGGRSGKAVEWLQSQGLNGLLNLRGGIIAYAEEADTSLPTY